MKERNQASRHSIRILRDESERSGTQALSSRSSSLTIVALVLTAAAVSLALWRLDTAPAPWWDEGWTMSVARNLVERGQYGRVLMGEPASSTLAQGPAVTLPVAVSFRLFGVGFWQARLPTVIALGAMSMLLFALTRRLFGPEVAALTLLWAIFLAPLPTASTLLFGRQVLGEIPMLAWLFAGLLCLSHALRDSLAWALAAVFCFTTALLTKPLLEPFLICGFIAAVWSAIGLQRKSTIVAAVGICSLALAHGFLRSRSWLLPGFVAETEPTVGLYRAAVFVLDRPLRLRSLELLLLYGAPTIASLVFASYWTRQEPHERCVVAFLVSMSIAWLVWFVTLSAGDPRYLFTPVLLATPFLARLTWRLATVKSSSSSRDRTMRMAATIAVAIAAVLGVRSFVRFMLTPADASAQGLAEWIDANTPASAAVETSESEIVFLLDRPTHYPPLPVLAEVIARFERADPNEVPYDALKYDTKYLVTGAFSSSARLYEPFVESGAFREVTSFGPYRVFQRARSGVP